MKFFHEVKLEISKVIAIGSRLTYQKFLDLYQPYSKIIPAIVFATEIINIREYSYWRLVNGNVEFTIIKPFIRLDEEFLGKIKSEIIESYDSVNYETFKTIHSSYANIISEKAFAKEIFNTNDSALKHIKKYNYFFKMPEEKNSFLEYYDKLYDFFYEQYKNKKIDYEVFKSVYAPYERKLTEVDFAACLGISYGSYRNMKKGRKQRYQVPAFYTAKVDYLRIDVKEIEGIYRNKMVDYVQFKEIYQQYGTSISEDFFARIIGISFSTFTGFKRKCAGSKTKIFDKPFSTEEKFKILLECKERGLRKKEIDYIEFCEYYFPYKQDISETDFADILGISQTCLIALRNSKSNKKVMILNTGLTFDVLKQIENQVKEFHNKYLTYSELQSLFEQYSIFISEKDFAKLLGIPTSTYKKLKNNSIDLAKIDFYRIEKLIILHQLSESRIYSIDQFNELCNFLDVELEFLMLLYIGEKNINASKRLLDVLKAKGQLYLGNTPMSKNAPFEKMLEICKRRAKVISYLCFCPEVADDIVSEAMIFTLENCGSFEINFGENLEEAYLPYITKVIKYMCFNYSYHNKRAGLLSLNSPIKNREGKTQIDYIAASEEGFSFEEGMDEGDVYDKILLAIDNGLEIKEAMKRLSIELNISQAKLLEILKEQAISKKLVKKDSNGK